MLVLVLNFNSYDFHFHLDLIGPNEKKKNRILIKKILFSKLDATKITKRSRMSFSDPTQPPNQFVSPMYSGGDDATY